MTYTEEQACTALPINENSFNSSCIPPYGLVVEYIKAVMIDFIDFLSLINSQLYRRQTPRLETMLMSANFSKIVCARSA